MKSLKKLYKELGGVDCGWYLFKRLFAVLFPALSVNRYKLLAQKVNGEMPSRCCGHESVIIKQVLNSDYNIDWFPRSLEIIQSRFAQHAICFVAFKNNQPAGCLWLVLGPYDEDEVKCKFVPQKSAAWDFDVYIKPEHRLSRIFMYLWHEANQYMRLNGIRWTMSRVDAFNDQSIRSHKRMGAIIIGSATFIGYGNLQVMLSSVYPFLHASMNKRHRPTLNLFSPRDHSKLA